MFAYGKIARILRTDKDILRQVEEKLKTGTGKSGVFDKIVVENQTAIKSRLEILGLKEDSSAKEIYNALITKVEADDKKLSAALGEPKCSNYKDWERVLAAALGLADQLQGFFLKKEKAAELILERPPEKIMKVLGYASAQEMLKNEDIFEVWSALRFVEGNDWLNQEFFKQYHSLTPDDFETRPIKVLALSDRWLQTSEDFIRRKYHNISHLKELGVVFALPLSLDARGELIRNFSLVLHYLNEIPFYSRLFEHYAQTQAFSRNLISLLSGETIDERLPSSPKSQWLIIQRYLAKEDENDWRLFEPHVNPEAIHWRRAESLLAKAGDLADGFSADLAFWQNLNWVGDYFKDETGAETLASFNLVDTVMSLVMRKELIKYLYHHQEALWNRIFAEYFGEEKLEELIKENIVKGWFEV